MRQRAQDRQPRGTKEQTVNVSWDLQPVTPGAYNLVVWDVEYTDEFGAWYEQLDEPSQRRVVHAVDVLAERGPALGRPLVDTIKGSRLQHLKELRPSGTTIRVLFAFDPRRAAILLLGGDKRNAWAEWYAEMIPVAERLYETYLEELRNEGRLP
jgi:hypothetical protein